MARAFLILFLATIATLQLKADVIPLPKDLATIEALISLHKQSASAEKEALNRLSASLAETSQIKQKTFDFNTVKQMLNSRTGSIYSYIILSSSLALTSKDLISLTKQFANFTSATTSTMFRKPASLWYYSEAIRACSREIKFMQAQMVRLGVGKFNLIKATMDEKMLFINTIRLSIQRCQRILDDAYMWCSFIVNGGYHRLFIWDILNSKTTEQIAHSIFSKFG